MELDYSSEQRLEIQEKIAAWNAMTDREITDAGLTAALRGRYFMPKDLAEKHQDVGLEGTAVIMLAVQDSPRPDEYLRVYARPEKDWVPYNTIVSPIDLGIEQLWSFHPDRGFPSPDDFEKEPYASPTSMLQRYLYLDTSAGLSLRHELTHNQRLNLNQSGDVKLDANEYWTDVQAMESIAKANTKWVESGDNSGYYFVFHRKGDPYYILTKEEQKRDQSSSTA